MPDWDRKNLDILGDAVSVRLKDDSIPKAQRQRLELIKERAYGAAKTTRNSVYMLGDVRAELCKLCRDDALHECDVKKGWPYSCAFLKKNSL